MTGPRTLTIAAVLLAGACVANGAGPAPPPKDGLTGAQADETLRAHNAWRKRAGVRALRWGNDLASRAQLRATYLAAHGCGITHGELPEDVGESLYLGWPLMVDRRPDAFNPTTPTQVVDAWGEESKFYSEKTDTCEAEKVCGHYTQMVWPSTDEVGCGMAVCPSLGQVWVCNYRPRGNIRIIR